MSLNKNEMELLKLIRENDHPERALATATNIIVDFLKQLESSEEAFPACLRELA